MSARVSLPASLTSATLSRSGEGVTFANQTASVPRSAIAARTLSPSAVQQQSVQRQPVMSAQQQAKPPVPGKFEAGYIFNPLNIVFLIVVFVTTLAILWLTKPNMVTDLENGKRVINTGKLILWTLIITIVIAVIGAILMSVLPRKQ